MISIHSERKGVDEFSIPIIDIARDLGSVKVANIVAPGTFVARSKLSILIY